jgi:hypothetical protein
MSSIVDATDPNYEQLVRALTNHKTASKNTFRRKGERPKDPQPRTQCVNEFNGIPKQQHEWFAGTYDDDNCHSQSVSPMCNPSPRPDEAHDQGFETGNQPTIEASTYSSDLFVQLCE